MKAVITTITLMFLTISAQAGQSAPRVSIQSVGVKGQPMAKTDKSSGLRYAAAKKGECYAVKNGKIIYTTIEIAKKFGAKMFTRDTLARAEAARQLGHSGKRNSGSKLRGATLSSAKGF